MTLIGAENTWGLWAVCSGGVLLSVWLEKKFKWAARISGAMIALLLAMLLANIRVIPTESAVYDTISGYFVPMAIPLLLVNTNIRKIWRGSGRMTALFLFGALGSFVGAFVGYAALKEYIPQLGEIAGMMVGTYIGGSVNLITVANSLGVSPSIISSCSVADNLSMSVYFVALLAVSSSAAAKKLYPYKCPIYSNDEPEEAVSDGSGISLIGLAGCGAFSIIMAAAAEQLSALISSIEANAAWELIKTFVGNKYLIVTVLTIAAATLFPGMAQRMRGASEIGTYLIYYFLFAIGAPASVSAIIHNSPIIFVFTVTVIIFNMAFTFIGGKIGRFSLEEIVIASNANIGGPTTAAGLAVSKGWSRLTVPAVLIGTLGYAIGTFMGILTANILM